MANEMSHWLSQQADEALKAIHAKRAELVEEHERVLEVLDQDIARIEESKKVLDAITVPVKAQRRGGFEVKAHTKRIRRGQRNGRNRRNAHQLAGPANVEAAEKALRKHGTATAAQVRKTTGKNSGTITYAMRALVEDGIAQPTGRTVDRSPEFRYVPKSERVVTRPGD